MLPTTTIERAQSQKAQVEGVGLDSQQLQKLRKALADALIDFTQPDAMDKAFSEAAQQGVSQQALFALRSSVVDYQTRLGSKTKTEVEVERALNDQRRGKLLSIIELKDPNEKQTAWQQEYAAEQQAGTVPPGPVPQYPGDEAATAMANLCAFASVLAKEPVE